MLTALVLVGLGQFQMIIEQPAPVVFEMPVIQAPTFYRYSYVPVVSEIPVVTYSAPMAVYSLRAEPMMPVYSPFWGRRAVIRERGPGFRSKTILRY
jgi:hypothetical protein